MIVQVQEQTSKRTNGIAAVLGQPSIAWLVLVLVFLITLVARWNVIQNRPLFSDLANEDATAHVLVTIAALRETPSSTTRLLPIVTYGAQHNKFIQSIPWSSGMDELGNEYYASFPPLGFLAPYAVFTLLGVDGTPSAIRWFAIAIQLVSAALVFVFFRRLLRLQQADDAMANITAVIAATIYLCLPESLKSHTLSYWHHILLQPIWIFTLLVLTTEWRHRTWLMFILGFLLASTEWTGYLINIAIAGVAIYLYAKHRLREHLILAVVFLAASLVAAFLMVGTYAATIGYDSYIEALWGRFQRRDTNRLAFIDLAVGYSKSFGTLWVVLLVGALAAIARHFTTGRRPAASEDAGFAHPSVMLFLLVFPAVENLLLANHAASYSFDRLKIALPLLYMFARGIAPLSKCFALLVMASTAVLGLLSLSDFLRQYEIDFASPAPRQFQQIGSVIVEYTKPNQVAFINNPISVYGTYYSGRNIVLDTKNIDSVVAWLNQQGASRAALFIVGGEKFGGPIDRINAMNAGAVSGILEVDRSAARCAFTVTLIPANYTDELWLDGRLRSSGNTILVHNKDVLGYLRIGEKVRSDDDALFQIASIEGNVLTLDGNGQPAGHLRHLQTEQRECESQDHSGM